MVWPRNLTRSVVELISPEERTTVISPACRLSDDAPSEVRELHKIFLLWTMDRPEVIAQIYFLVNSINPA